MPTLRAAAYKRDLRSPQVIAHPKASVTKTETRETLNSICTTPRNVRRFDPVSLLDVPGVEAFPLSARRLLLIEDDRDIAALLRLHLRDLGCDVQVCHDGTEGLTRATDGTRWSLIVLDLGLPGVDGMEICRLVRSAPDYSPIVMLTARDSEVERVRGLDFGADDYITKPFSIVEFVARVKAILRRVDNLARRQTMQWRTLRDGELLVNLDQREVRRAGVLLDLTAREFDLLCFLMQHPARVFSRSQLLDQVWGSTHETFEHTVNSHINRLRAKVEPDPANPRYIETVWGVGYRFAPDRCDGH